MRIHELSVSSFEKSKRSGRGISAGRGKTAGRGTKGQNSRTGGKVKPGFEGGQNPLTARIPKLPGAKTKRRPRMMQRPKTQTVTLSDLERAGIKVIDSKVLHDKGYISSAFTPVKVVSKGKINNAVTVKLQYASKKATEAISKAGGSFEQIGKIGKPKKKST